ncbi:MAG: hypothetical protein M3N25_07880, partial [Actinomycetota bacterium]|nr:hypothetical protein [Actinomycetota bacterium]
MGGVEVVGAPVEAGDEGVPGGLEAGPPAAGEGDELLDGFVSRLAGETEGGLEERSGWCGHGRHLLICLGRAGTGPRGSPSRQLVG